MEKAGSSSGLMRSEAETSRGISVLKGTKGVRAEVRWEIGALSW